MVICVRTVTGGILAMAMLAAGAAAHASQQVVPIPPAPIVPRDGGKPPVDPTAVIKGRVVAADTGKPLRRARVSVRAPELTDGQRTTTTSLDGRYEIKNLPAGRYRVSVTRGGYLGLDHGQRRPGELGRPVQIADGQALDKVDFALPRMSTISGRVTDESGDPIEGVRIFPSRMMFYEGRRRLVPIGGTPIQTDDEGQYRISRLSPGHYHVMATTKETWTVTENGVDRVIGYMPTYFPGVPTSGEARRLTVAVGQHLDAIDFALVPGRAAKVSGIAVDSQHRPFARVSMSEEVRGLNFGSFGAGPSTTVAADGSFTISSVPPGEYTISASRTEADSAGVPEVAIATIFVDGNDIENLQLTGSSGGIVTGRVVVEGDTPPKMSAVFVRVRQALRIQPSPVLLGLDRRTHSTSAKDDGTFVSENVFGKTRFQVTLPAGWMVKTITHEGRDVADALIELGSGETMSGVEVVITNRLTSVGGRLEDEKKNPVQDATVVVFDAEPEKWFESSRRVHALRPDQGGQWEVKGLPAGDYLAVALDYVEEGAWNDPEYLDGLKRYAERITVADGTSQSVALKVVTPKQ